MRRQRSRKAASCLVIVGLLGFAGTGIGAERKLADPSIRDAVEDEFLLDPAVSFNEVNVKVSDGIVTLSGTVNNLLTKDRAVVVAELVKGVRAVVDRINVEPLAKRSDSDIQDDVSVALLSDPATESYEVNASADHGRVVLTGTVDSWRERQLCAQVAKGVKGVTAVENSIEVDYETDRPDSEIKAEIEKTLRWNTLVDDGLIDVTVNNGKVTLIGTVGSAAEKRQARYDAWVAGVTSVNDSGLEVKAWAKNDDLRQHKYVAKSEEEIRKAVQDALVHDPRVFSFNVAPEVSGSFVTLRGTVGNLKAKRAAEMDARNTVGASVVRNRLKVRPISPPDDNAIETEIREALERDPYVDRYEITVNVLNGTAYLYGNVDTFFEKSQADDIASRVSGVVNVKNRLVVDYDYNAPVYGPGPYGAYPYDDWWYAYRPPLTTKTDAEIKDDVEDELWWSPYVDSEDLTVSVDDGVVTLRGFVSSWNERTAAVKNAYDGGATRVVDKLVLHPAAG